VNPWHQIQPVLEGLSPGALAGKPLIDVSNEIDFSVDPPRRPGNAMMPLAARVQAWAPRARVVKTLNVLPAALMVTPAMHGLAPVMWMSGDDATAKAVVERLLHDLGWAAVHDLGPLSASRLQEGLGLNLSILLSQMLRATRGQT
jgi:predicted dinucleotide-binding enzyme